MYRQDGSSLSMGRQLCWSRQPKILHSVSALFFCKWWSMIECPSNNLLDRFLWLLSRARSTLKARRNSKAISLCLWRVVWLFGIIHRLSVRDADVVTEQKSYNSWRVCWGYHIKSTIIINQGTMEETFFQRKCWGGHRRLQLALPNYTLL
jgi:hypothetical protein